MSSMTFAEAELLAGSRRRAWPAAPRRSAGRSCPADLGPVDSETSDLAPSAGAGERRINRVRPPLMQVQKLADKRLGRQCRRMTPDHSPQNRPPRSALATRRGDRRGAPGRPGWRSWLATSTSAAPKMDILAVDPRPPPMLVLVEVRWRGERGFGLPEESVDWRKRRKLRGAIGATGAGARLPDGTPLPSCRCGSTSSRWSRRGAGRRPDRLRHHRSAVGSG